MKGSPVRVRASASREPCGITPVAASSNRRRPCPIPAHTPPFWRRRRPGARARGPAADVAAFKREPFLPAQAGAGGEERDHAERSEFVGENLHLRPRVEGADLLPLRERVGNVAGRVLVQDLRGAGRGRGPRRRRRRLWRSWRAGGRGLRAPHGVGRGNALRALRASSPAARPRGVRAAPV